MILDKWKYTLFEIQAESIAQAAKHHRVGKLHASLHSGKNSYAPYSIEVASCVLTFPGFPGA